MDEELIGYFALYGIIAVIGLAIVVIRFIFDTIIGKFYYCNALRSYHLDALLYILSCFNKMENMGKKNVPIKRFCQ